MNIKELNNEILQSFRCYVKAYIVVKKEYSNFTLAFFAVSVLFMLTSALSALLPYLLKQVADTYSQQLGDISTFFIVAMTYSVVWLVAEVLKNIKGIFSAGILGRSNAAITERALHALLASSYTKQKDYDPAVISANITRGASAFSALTVSIFWTICPIILEIFLALFFLNHTLGFTYSFIFFLSIVGLAFLAIYIAIRSRNIHADLMHAQNAVNSYSVTRLGIPLDIRLNKAHKREKATRAVILQQYIETISRTNRQMGLLLSLQSLAVGILLATSVFALVIYRGSSQLGAGDFILIAGYIGMLTMQLRMIAGACIDIQRNIVYLREVLLYTSEQPGGFKRFSSISSPLTTPVFEANNIASRFGERVLFEELNFKVFHGETLAISAPSGFGKSTIINYLLGLEKPAEGSIFFNGFPVSVESSNEILSKVSVVPQKSQLIPGTIRENLLYGAEVDIGDAGLGLILKQLEIIPADSTSYVPFLDRYVTPQGSGLSGGEIQRICIARAMVRDADTIILDEPTSSIGEALSIKIIDLLKNQFSTIVIVTHNPKIMAMTNRRYEPLANAERL